jgi:type IV secretory pathway TrbL component
MEGTTEEAMAGENSTEQTSTEKTMSGQNQTAKAVQNTTEGSLKNVTASTNVTNTTQAVEDVGPSSILYPGKCITVDFT